METAGKVELALRISKQSKSRFKFKEEVEKTFENKGLFIYTTTGEVKYFTDLNALSIQTLQLQGREDGGYYATAIPYQNFKLPGQDSIRLPRHPPETAEYLNDHLSINIFNHKNQCDQRLLLFGTSIVYTICRIDKVL